MAWRDGNMVEAEIFGRTSLEDRQPQPRANAFQWVGLWPLIGVALAQEKSAEAMDYVRMLLDPSQQLPPESLLTPLAATIQTWDAGQHEVARSHLQQAVPLAEEMGYL